MRNFKELLSMEMEEEIIHQVRTLNGKILFIGTFRECTAEAMWGEFGVINEEGGKVIGPSNIVFNINYFNELLIDNNIEYTDSDSIDDIYDTLRVCLLDKETDKNHDYIVSEILTIRAIRNEYKLYLKSKEAVANSDYTIDDDYEDGDDDITTNSILDRILIDDEDGNEVSIADLIKQSKEEEKEMETKVIETVNNENEKEVSVMNNEIKGNTAEEVALQIVAAIEEAERMAHLTLVERIEDMLTKIETIKYPFNEGYVTKDMIADLISEVIGNRPNTEKKSRDVLIEALLLIHHNLTINEAVVEDKPFVAVGDLAITNDNAPSNLVNNKLIDDTTSTTTQLDVVFDNKLAMTILKNIILQADKNSQHNFISDWMLTSVISELTIGYPLKGKDKNGNWVEFYKTFTKEQEGVIDKIRSEFLTKSKFVPKIDSGEVKGYHIPAKSLVYGRHMWLNKACVYKFKDVEYHVSLNGIKNTKTGNITKLSDDAYSTLDSKCVFFK